MADAAPPELGELLRNVFYKHSAPLALQNQGVRQRYPERRRPKGSADLIYAHDSAIPQRP